MQVKSANLSPVVGRIRELWLAGGAINAKQPYLGGTLTMSRMCKREHDIHAWVRNLWL